MKADRAAAKEDASVYVVKHTPHSGIGNLAAAYLEVCAELEAETREYIKLHEEFETERKAKVAFSDDATRHLSSATELGEKLIAALNWQPTAEHWMLKAHEFQSQFLDERKARKAAERLHEDQIMRQRREMIACLERAEAAEAKLASLEEPIKSRSSAPAAL